MEHVKQLRKGERLPVPVSRPPTRLVTRDAWSATIRAAIDAEPVEDGYSHPLEEILEDVLIRRPESADWVLAAISEGQRCESSALLRCLGRLESPGSETWRSELIAAGLRSPEVEVRDAAVQAVENWDEDSLKNLLRQHDEKVSWLDEYIRQVAGNL
jgi:hypothetical protein